MSTAERIRGRPHTAATGVKHTQQEHHNTISNIRAFLYVLSYATMATYY